MTYDILPDLFLNRKSLCDDSNMYESGAIFWISDVSNIADKICNVFATDIVCSVVDVCDIDGKVRFVEHTFTIHMCDNDILMRITTEHHNILLQDKSA